MLYELLIRKPPEGESRYRGVYTAGPSYHAGLEADHPLNRAFIRYAEQGAEIRDLDTALANARAFTVAGEPFDVLSAQPAPTEPAPSTRIGFDIAQNENYSLLSWNLHWGGTVPLPPPPERDVFRLLEAYFRPRLNDYGLFDRWTDARFS
jgi:hypothetical protein